MPHDTSHSLCLLMVTLAFAFAFSLTGCGNIVCETKHSLSNGYDLALTQPDTWEVSRPVDVVVEKNGVKQFSTILDNSDGNCVTSNYVLSNSPTDSDLFILVRKGDNISADTITFIIDTKTGESWPFRTPTESREDSEKKKNRLFSRWP